MKKAVASVIAIASMLFGSTVPAFASYQPSGLLDVPMPDTTPILQGTDDAAQAVNYELHEIQYDQDMITYAKYLASVPGTNTTPDDVNKIIQSCMDDIQTMLQMLQSNLSKIDPSKLDASTQQQLQTMFVGFSKYFISGLTPLKSGGIVISSSKDEAQRAGDSTGLAMASKLATIMDDTFKGKHPNAYKEFIRVNPGTALTGAAVSTALTDTFNNTIFSGIPEEYGRTNLSSDFAGMFNPLNNMYQKAASILQFDLDGFHTIGTAVTVAGADQAVTVENLINNTLDGVSKSNDSPSSSSTSNTTQTSSSSTSPSPVSSIDNTQPNSVNNNINIVPSNATVEVIDTGTSVPNVRVNGQDVVFVDAKPFINSDNRTMVPIRFIADKFNATTQWDENKQEAIITCNGQRVVLQIGSKVAYINNTPFQMDTEAVTKDGRTFVPLVLIGKAFNVPVEWNTGLSTSQVVAN